MTNNNAKENLYQFVNTLRNDLEIKLCSYPVNTVEICDADDSTEILYHTFNTNGFCGAALIGDKVDTVILNSNRDDSEKNFDCGHEIVHLTKHRNKGIDRFSCFELNHAIQAQNSFLEWEANEGSAEFIVPYQSLLPEIKKSLPALKASSDYRSFKRDMANKFNVTDMVVNFRLESLKYEIQQYISGTSLNNLKFLSNKQQIAKGIEVKSFNDIEDELFRSEYHIFFCDRSCLNIAK